MGSVTRRGVVLGGTAMAGAVLGHGWAPGLSQRAGVPRIDVPTDPLILNDASGLSATPIHSHVRPAAHGDALVAAFRAELAAARAEGRAVNVGAARHSMGGQAIPRGGHAITVDDGWLEADTAAGTYRVNGGARWRDVIAALDPLGFSPAVMQSNHDFGVAATFSVGAHGWPVPYGPMGATVRSLRMVLPDGELVTASRSENAELFALATGGYGLIGLIVDLEVEMVPNQRLAPSFARMAAADFPAAFAAAVADPGTPMAYGRLNVDRAGLFEEALLATYAPTPDQSDLPPATGSGLVSHLASTLYRGQVGREGMKRLRWWIEAGLGPRIAGEATRNSLMNEPVATLDDRDPGRVDILHEYFVPYDAFDGFLAACREVIPDAFVEFLNVTLRHVEADRDSLLAHSPGPRIAAVMSFTQEMTARAEADHQRLTRALIDRVVALGGSYYLPYRPHATVAQFTAAYPRAAEFAAAKRALDPSLTLRNALWDGYMEGL
ncbi:FAD-binding oxidoreductase [Roseicyclus persicicus]|uniref:FAD-binding oxidoreductase n=1 Tax=Roseicyclus persicicus TaxID=2650661 RepID=A0A7X6GX77_9RHOB|nr:FAD-binding oxidoreductase [Roseibacterium persicicum]NKX44049.1 FAD-binding oxidoreductase [Roseibacterium persicicum]